MNSAFAMFSGRGPAWAGPLAAPAPAHRTAGHAPAAARAPRASAAAPEGPGAQGCLSLAGACALVAGLRSSRRPRQQPRLRVQLLAAKRKSKKNKSAGRPAQSAEDRQSEGYCPVCDLVLDSGLKALLGHMTGQAHKENYEKAVARGETFDDFYAPRVQVQGEGKKKKKGKKGSKSEKPKEVEGLDKAIKRGDLRGSITCFEDVCGQGIERGKQHNMLYRVLMLAVREGTGGASLKAEATFEDALRLVLLDDEMVFTPQQFVVVLEALVCRMPVPTESLRLFLNLCVPPGGKAVPRVSPVADFERENGADFYPTSSEDQQQELLNLSRFHGRVKIDDPDCAAYFAHFATLLNIEFLQELEGVQRRLGRNPEDLERFGNMVSDLKCDGVEKDGSAVFTQVVGLDSFLDPMDGGMRRPGRRASQELRFSTGMSVYVSSSGPLTSEAVVCGVIMVPDRSPGSRSSDERIILSVPRGEVGPRAFSKQSAQAGTWRIDAAANYAAYNKQMHALMQIATTKREKRMPLWDLLTHVKVGGNTVDGWAAEMQERFGDRMHLSLQHTGTSETLGMSEEELQRRAATNPGADSGRTKALQRALRDGSHEESHDLNQSQRDAVAAALTRQLTLIQGPPGTGKTHTSVKLLKLFKATGVGPVMCTSDSNIAVDNIATLAHKQGLNVVRVGRTEKVGAELDSLSLNNLCAKQRPPSPQELRRMSPKERRAETKRRREMDEAALKAVLRSADVVCVTTISSASWALKQAKYGALLIDEVAQATEASVLVPIVCHKVRRLVLVGDQCQLPPSVMSLETEIGGLSLSLFGRLIAQGLETHFLDTQFRMHPMIAAYSSEAYYDNKLLTGVTAAQRPAPVGFDWPDPDSGIAFVNVKGMETKADGGVSWSNSREAREVMSILGDFLTAGELSVLDVGIVSPYAGQVKVLRQEASSLTLRGHDLTGGRTGRQARNALEIASVDNFQGREKELIIFSAVRSNSWGNVGFLKDWRRLNVMVTRARRGLIVVGDFDTLSQDKEWGGWVTFAQKNGLVATRKSTRRSRQEEEYGPYGAMGQEEEDLFAF